MRRSLPIWALVIGLLICSVPAWAVGGPITMTASAGFDGFARTGRLVPVTIFLQNDGPEVSGEIRFEATNPMGPMRSVGKHSYRVVVPAGATKRLDLLVPGMGLDMPKLQFVADGQVLAEVQPPISMVGDYLLGILGVDAGDLPGLGGMKINEFTVRMLPIATDRFPADAEALENLDALLLDRVAVAELSAEQLLALKSWVEHGGLLVLAGGPEARRLEGLSPWLPLSIQDSRMVDLPGIGRAPLAQVDLTEWTVLHSAGDEPLVAWRKQGGGKVYLLTFDPALEPFASWSELPKLMEPLLSTRVTMAAQGMGMGDPMQMLADNLAQFPVAPLPWLKKVLLLLIGYARLVGPVHVALLRRFRKAGWMALSIPLLVAGLGGGVWYASGASASTSPPGVTLAILEGQQGGHSLKYQALAGFYTPPGTRFDVAFGDAHLSPVASWAMQNPGRPGEPPSVELQLQEGRLAIFDKQESWGIRAVSAKTRLPVEGGVRTNLVILDGQLSGTVTNDLPFTLEHAVVLLGARGQVLGDLAPGQTAEVSVPITLNEWELGNPHALIDGVHQVIQVVWDPMPSPEQSMQIRRQNLAGAAIHGMYASPGGRPTAVVMGFSSEVPLLPRVNGAESKDGAQAVYVQPVDPTYGVGGRIPHGILQPEPVGGIGGQLWPGWDLGPGEERVFEFTVPTALLSHLTQAELRAGPMRGSFAGPNPVQIDLLRWSDEQWVTVPQQDFGDIDVPLTFIRADGLVRLRLIKVGAAQHVPLQIPSLSVLTQEVP